MRKLQNHQMSSPLIYSLMHTVTRLVAFFTCLPTKLIFGQWVADGWPSICTDHGPNSDDKHNYTGYHQICCLNNMIPLCADAYFLWDSYKIGVDVSVSPTQ